MKFYSVVVRPGGSDRFTDSHWLSSEAAKDLVRQLRSEFGRRKYSLSAEGEATIGWGAWIVDNELQDAKLVPDPDAKPD